MFDDMLDPLDADPACIVSLEEAGLEEPKSQPIFGGLETISNNIYGYVSWFYDDDDSAFSVM